MQKLKRVYNLITTNCARKRKEEKTNNNHHHQKPDQTSGFFYAYKFSRRKTKRVLNAKVVARKNLTLLFSFTDENMAFTENMWHLSDSVFW